jgi:hypothetical protein
LPILEAACKADMPRDEAMALKARGYLPGACDLFKACDATGDLPRLSS